MTTNSAVRGMSPEQARAFTALVEAATRGDGASACRIGDLYRDGREGLRHSPAEARRWYARSALAGDANGQNNLGACFQFGIGGAQSFRQAVHWYRRGAAQRLEYAAGNLGYCYLYGRGVPKDPTVALQWFERAIEFGDGREVTRELVETLRAQIRRTGREVSTPPHGGARDPGSSVS
jgi:hypothetical protein